MPPADSYFQPYGITDPARTVIRTAGRQIRERAARYFSGKMMEIGCGTKGKGLLVGEFVAEHVGLDHEGCLHDMSHIDVLGTAYDIPAEDESFDCVLSTSVIEHLEEPEKALREAHRILKPGGYAMYTAPLFWHLHEEPRDFFRYTRYGLKYLFEAAGFEIIEITGLSGFWTTFGTALSYYLQRFKLGPFACLVNAIVAFIQTTIPWLDRGVLRDERFTWMYLALVRKPAASSDQVDREESGV